MKRIITILTLILFFSVNNFSQNACNKRIERHLRLAGDRAIRN